MLFFFALLALNYAFNTEAMFNEIKDADPLTVMSKVGTWNKYVTNNRLHLKQKRSSFPGNCLRNNNFTSCEFPSEKRNVEQLTSEKRLAVFIANVTLTNANIVAEIGDTMHKRLINGSRGLYTTENMAAFDAEAMKYTANVLGSCFNFTGQPYVPGLFGIGGYMSPCGVAAFLPYVIGLNDTDPNNLKYTYQVSFDSANLGQGVTENWVVLAGGNLIYVLANVTTPQGNFYPGNGFGFADYAQVNLEREDWSRPINRVINRIVPPSASYQIGLTPFTPTFPSFQLSLTPLRVFDGCCNVGTGSISAIALGPNLDNIGPLRKITTVTMFWPN